MEIGYSQEHLNRAILEVNASGLATTREDMESFCQCTLLAAEKLLEDDVASNGKPALLSQKDKDSCDPIGVCTEYLKEREFIRPQIDEITKENHFIATNLGSACLGITFAIAFQCLAVN